MPEVKFFGVASHRDCPGARWLKTPAPEQGEHTFNSSHSPTIVKCQTKRNFVHLKPLSEVNWLTYFLFGTVCPLLDSKDPHAHLTRSKLPWFLRNRQILKNLNITIMETDNRLVSKIQISVVSHTNPSISSLLGSQLKPSNCHRRSCHLLEYYRGLALNNSHYAAIPKIARPLLAQVFSLYTKSKIVSLDLYFGSCGLNW